MILTGPLPACAPPPAPVSSLPAEPAKTEAKKTPPTESTPPAAATVAAPAPVAPSPPAARAPAPVTVQPAPTLKAPGGGDQPVRVGLLLPLTGQGVDAGLGRAMLDAALLALFEVGDERLMLLPRDTGGPPEGAARAAAEVLGEGAEMVLGPLFSTSVTAAATVARQRGVPMIAFSSDRRVAGDGVYLLSFTPAQEVEAVVGFALSRGLRRFAALVPQDPYGLAVLQAAREALLTLGGELVQSEFYSPDGDDLDNSVKRLAHYHGRRQALLARRNELANKGGEAARRMLEVLKKHDTLGALNYDAVLLPEGGELLKSLAPLLLYYDVDTSDVRLLGTGRWDDPRVRLEPALQGGWFAGADRAAAVEFRARYRKAFGRVPPRLASLAYDGTALAAVLAREKGGADYSARAIAAPDGFVGSDGIFRFGADGVAQRGLAVLEIERDGFRVLRPAPTSFEELTN